MELAGLEPPTSSVRYAVSSPAGAHRLLQAGEGLLGPRGSLSW